MMSAFNFFLLLLPLLILHLSHQPILHFSVATNMSHEWIESHEGEPARGVCLCCWRCAKKAVAFPLLAGDRGYSWCFSWIPKLECEPITCGCLHGSACFVDSAIRGPAWEGARHEPLVPYPPWATTHSVATYCNYMSMWTTGLYSIAISILLIIIIILIEIFNYLFTSFSYRLVQVTKDYRLARVSGPLTYNDITSTSSEGGQAIWTERERDWEETEAIDTGQTRVCKIWFCFAGGRPGGVGGVPDFQSIRHYGPISSLSFFSHPPPPSF